MTAAEMDAFPTETTADIEALIARFRDLSDKCLAVACKSFAKSQRNNFVKTTLLAELARRDRMRSLEGKRIDTSGLKILTKAEI